MRLEDLYYLLSPEGQRLLAELAPLEVTAETHLQLATSLREQVGPERTHALLETTLLRRQATTKFSRAAEMYFIREALEQATAEEVSRYRARRFQRLGYGYVADLGCGIGGDAISLAAGARVVGIDWEPLRLAMAQENLRIYGHGEQFEPLQADIIELGPLAVEALFADPGRRDAQGRRIYSLHAYQPPVSTLDNWRKTVPNQCIKISPGVHYDELPPDAEVEFISVQGEVREGVLWFGDFRTGTSRRATLLPGPHSMVAAAGPEIPVTEPKMYLYEPDGAVIRAHLIEELARELEAQKIDPDIAYLTSDKVRSTPFARTFTVEDVMPFNLKGLRQYLRERSIGQVTIKKRGSAVDPDLLRGRLRLQGADHCLVFLTQVRGKPTVIIGQELKSQQDNGGS